MRTAILFGIKNCDTMKKAFKWLDSNNIPYAFRDYKKGELDEKILKGAIATHGWEIVINKRGTTWRQLPTSVQNKVTNANALNLATENTSLIKRPLLLHKGKTYLGFSDESYKTIFGL